LWTGGDGVTLAAGTPAQVAATLSREEVTVTFGKPGRPPQDRLARQRELYTAVAPLLLAIGPRRLSMQRAARAAHVSVGGLYHWFPTKRDLVLHALRPEVLARSCDDFHARSGHLAAQDPAAYLAAYLDYAVATVAFVRPSALAALELGAPAFLEGAQAALTVGLDEFDDAVAVLRPGVPDAERRGLSRVIRSTMFAALLDTTLSPRELAAELRLLLDGRGAPRPSRRGQGAGTETPMPPLVPAP